MACTSILDNDILYDCDYSSVAGLETNVVLINREDIDFTNSTINAINKICLDDLQLKTGKTGYLFQGVKQVNSSAFELVKKETGSDKFKHIFNGVILTLTKENKLQLQQLSEGASIVAVVERKWKGQDSKEAFEVYGFGVGLELNAATYNSNENDGTGTIELSSVDGFEEAKVPYTLLETNYNTTKTAFDNKFAA